MVHDLRRGWRCGVHVEPASIGDDRLDPDGVLGGRGQGIAVDKSKAYIWFNLAAAKGHERAREARDNLLPALTAEQVLAAQRAAQEWRPVPTKQ